MIRRLGISFLILFSSLQVFAIDAVVSHTVFYRPNPQKTNSYDANVEVYWQVNPRKLHYTTTPEKTIIARIKTDIFFSMGNDMIKEDHFILQTVPRNNVSELAKNSIIELRRYNFPSGYIKMRFVLTDIADSTSHFVYTDSFTIPTPVGKAFYSGLELLDTTIMSDAETAFKKNGRQQIPACTNFIDDSRNKLHYYAELYGTNELPATIFPLVQNVAISKKENEGFYGNFINTDTLTGKQLCLANGSFNIASLPSGNYYLRVTVESNKHNLIAAQSLFFQRLNLHPAEEAVDTTKKTPPKSDTGMENVTLLDLSKTFVAKYTLGEVREILKMLLPVSDPLGTQNIRNFLKEPNDLYMRYYVYNFFVYQNKENPEKAWKEYSIKVIEVNKLFSGHGSRGYETDRGFVYLKYGAPTDIITVENDPGTTPYEIWQYNTLTQTNHKDIADALFLFYKQLATSDFKLLHSTVDGEVQNPGWRSYLYTNSDAANSGNSRVEQYIGNR